MTEIGNVENKSRICIKNKHQKHISMEKISSIARYIFVV